MQGTPYFHRITRLLTALMLALLAACSVAPSKQPPATREAQAQELMQQGKYADAAKLYEGLAAGAQGIQQTEFLVSASEAWSGVGNGNGQRSWTLLGQIKNPKTLYPALQARIEILKAELDLAGHQPQVALSHLRFPLEALPDEIKAATLLVRGRIHVAMDDLPSAVEDWSERETYLPPNGKDAAANEQLIWQTLTATHTALDVTKLPASLSPTARGWLELANIAHTSWQQPEKFIQAIKDWENSYPQHPAMQQLVPELLAKQQALTAFPPRVAVMLPLNGNFQAPADAVRDGLLAAYFQLAGNGEAPALSYYDSGTDAASAQAAYQKAVSDGANMVIGPLTKDAVAGLAALPSLPVPVLALNYLDAGKSGPMGFYQFGLLPEGEAEQAAERAVAEGYTRGMALVSNDDFGRRMLNAFSARFAQLGGDLLATGNYAPGGDNDADTINRLLNLDASQDREEHLAATLNSHLEFEPRRRQDVQFIFLAGSAEDARQIQPLISYYHADDVPVFSTSRVYELNSNVDNTVLNGITFGDMPWTLVESGSMADMRGEVEKDWPGNFAVNSRLYALGFDAYRLLPLLYNTHTIGEPVQGVTGLLSLDDGRRVHRNLDWASFDDGSANLLPPLTLPAPPATTPATVTPAPSP
ncbi:MAG TPA: penicillin-binding protein activator [Gammaproteobacteria bacterium]|nr:penicillin-binding protein activator [Gammaproteobacteria bacterium]